MSRFKKLLMVGLILSLGIGLAWPFRKDGSESIITTPEKNMQPSMDIVTKTDTGKSPNIWKQESENSSRHVVARMASTREGASQASQNSSTAEGASFDLANHPTNVNQPVRTTTSPVTPTTRANQADVGQEMLGDGDEVAPTEVVHIVRNTDTLEKLAERYLGDGGRALEIFDLNRDRLENPHLLPIGAELRIPADPARMVE